MVTPKQETVDAITELSADSDPLVEQLNRSPYQYDFFQALRRIESLSTQWPRVGHSRRATQEPVRIGQTAALDFAPATIDRVDTVHDGRVRISQRFFGLWGPAGPLPLHMTEQVRDQIRHDDDTTQSAFLNLFHHRMAVLFYRAWSSSRGAISRDRPNQDRFAEQVAALSGVMHVAAASPAGTSPSEKVPSGDSASRSSASTEAHQYDAIERFFTGRFAAKRRTSEGLQAIVAAAFHCDVVIETFQLRRLRLHVEDHSRLRATKATDGRGGRLGQSVVLGRTVPDRRSLIAMKIGPLAYRDFQCLLPGGSRHSRLGKLIRRYVDAGIDCRVRLILDHNSVPRMALGRKGKLGQNAWLHSRPPKEDLGHCEFLV